MKTKRLLAFTLVLANVFSVTSCIKVDDKSIYKKCDKIASAVVDLDAKALEDYCSGSIKKLESAMPVIDDEEEVDDDLIVKSLIASTLQYEVDKKSFEADKWGRDCSIDVIFTYNDHHEVFEGRELFLDIDDFAELYEDVSDKIEVTVTLEFEKDGDDMLLTNPEDLAVVYQYEDTELEYVDKLFDLVDSYYMTGDTWDQFSSTYTDTTSLEMVLDISDTGSLFDWNYSYVISQVTPYPCEIYSSGDLVAENPEEIVISYSESDLLPEGNYSILVYNGHDTNVIGCEFEVAITPEVPDDIYVEGQGFLFSCPTSDRVTLPYTDISYVLPRTNSEFLPWDNSSVQAVVQGDSMGDWMVFAVGYNNGNTGLYTYYLWGNPVDSDMSIQLLDNIHQELPNAIANNFNGEVTEEYVDVTILGETTSVQTVHINYMGYDIYYCYFLVGDSDDSFLVYTFAFSLTELQENISGFQYN